MKQLSREQDFYLEKSGAFSRSRTNQMQACRKGRECISFTDMSDMSHGTGEGTLATF